MSGSFCVYVLCTNGRRETVRVTPNSSILQVLEEACKKQKINAMDFELRHHNRILDLSLPIRFANLPNNTLLEMRPASKSRADCLVTVALQLESGKRIEKDFSPSATIYDVVEQCLKTESVNVEEIGEPVCIYMRQKIIGDAFKSTTLRSLGLTNGKASIRLMYRKLEVLEDQAHVSSPLKPAQTLQIGIWDSHENKPDPLVPEQTEKHSCVDDAVTEQNNSINEIDMTAEQNSSVNETETENASHTEDCMKMHVDDTDSPMLDKNTSSYSEEESAPPATDFEVSLDQKSSMSINSDPQEDVIEEIGDINYIGERHAVIYSLDDITDVKKADLPDEFFELTVNEVRYLFDSYQKERKQLENQPLITKDQRQRQIMEKLARYNQTVIRVYFPERLVLQAVFQTTETVQTVQDFIQNYLENKNSNFYLYITPPKAKLNPSKTLLETMLIPAANIYFGCETQYPNYLMGNLRDQLSDPRAAALAASESRKESSNNSQNIEENVNSITVESKIENINTAAITTPYQPPTESKGKVPKWLKLNKK
ncbi:tether containing UBX domain for GLUT4 [Caerostris darwini]|uniref:Tether containing UBX domain for GLUT4 n=1 Tax=Caerostris darwini TaxID=1538125 RepID=A0AAV4R6W0_9ARAC|nr:tether containing UBX domain for GLUT4 [Caerostris darwini]